MIAALVVSLVILAVSFSALLRCALGRVQQQMEYRPN